MPEVQHVFDSIRLGAKVPTPPVLIVQAVHDYLIDVEDIDRLADAYSAGGADVTYHRDAFNEHLLLHPLSAPMALRWLQDRFARRPLTDHLVRRNGRRCSTRPPTLAWRGWPSSRPRSSPERQYTAVRYDGVEPSALSARGYTASTAG